MSNCSCKCSRCHEDEKFDAKAAFEKLSRRQIELADIVMRYMSEAGMKRPKRAESALMMAANVATIFGGESTDGFPDCCSVDSAQPCSGVLIHPRIVLTAAHCVSPAKVRLNSTTRNSGGELINVLIARRHPNFNSATGFFDIRVLVLQHASSVLPAPIAAAADLMNAGETTLVGFGRSEFGTGVKRVVTVNIDPNPDVDVFDPEREFVAGGDGQGTCDGDSGGPAYLHLNGQRRLAGLTSRSVGNNCGDGSIYTRVDVHLDFIRDVAAQGGIIF